MARRKRKPQGPLYCCGCAAMVPVRLTTGAEIYPRRSDLFAKQFWICACGAYVGCHKGTEKPLGNLPTEELRRARNHIHALLDPLWRSRRIARGDLYARISARIDKPYHTGEVLDIEEARRIYRIGLEIARSLA
jgi:hypothetical protein